MQIDRPISVEFEIPENLYSQLTEFVQLSGKDVSLILSAATSLYLMQNGGCRSVDGYKSASRIYLKDLFSQQKGVPCE